MRHARFTSVTDEDSRWVERIEANHLWQVWSASERRKLAEFEQQEDAWEYVRQQRSSVGPMFVLPPKP